MESFHLKQFLHSVGKTVHSLNTVCVGLQAVELGEVRKPDSLTITWVAHDPQASARQSRNFVLKSSLVFVREALAGYIRKITNNPTISPALRTSLKESDGISARFTHLSNAVNMEKNYWLPMVLLLLHWRNRIVHNSTQQLTENQRRLIVDSSDEIRSLHAGIDVLQTLKNFDQKQITLKDISTLIAICIRSVKCIDQQLMPTSMNVEHVDSEIKQRNLDKTFKKIVSIKQSTLRTRKIGGFFTSYFPDLEDSVRSDLVGRYQKKAV